MIGRRLRSLPSDFRVGEVIVETLTGPSCLGRRIYRGPGDTLRAAPPLSFLCIATAASAALSISRKFVELSRVVREDAALLFLVANADPCRCL